ncbi:MAG: DNA-directed RNA polymerase subunit L [Candidatus Woesearchaeota archaeon]
MEVKIIEQTKKKIIFEVPGANHTFCNILKDELWNDKKVTIATYSISHPLAGKPVFVVEVDDADPKKVVLSACNRLKKINEELAKKVARIKQD